MTPVTDGSTGVQSRIWANLWGNRRMVIPSVGTMVWKLTFEHPIPLLRSSNDMSETLIFQHEALYLYKSNMIDVFLVQLRCEHAGSSPTPTGD